MNSNRGPTLFAFLAFLPAVTFAQTVLLGQDSCFYGTNTANFGNSALVSVGHYAFETLVQLDLSASGVLPAGTTSSSIAKATLALFVNKIVTAGSVDIRTASGAWTENTVSRSTRVTAATSVAARR